MLHKRVINNTYGVVGFVHKLLRYRLSHLLSPQQFLSPNYRLLLSILRINIYFKMVPIHDPFGKLVPVPPPPKLPSLPVDRKML